MLSWQAMTLNGFLRFTMKRHGKKGIDLERLRARPPKMALTIPRGMQIDSIRSDQGLQFDLVTEQTRTAATPAAIVLYLHGGGYLFGSTKTHRQVLIAMAKAFDAPVYGLDYRLAPEHPFPAAFEDALLAYRWLLDRHPGTDIVLAGDSAGAGLAIAAALAIRDDGLPAPKAIVGVSPYSDLAGTGVSV